MGRFIAALGIIATALVGLHGVVWASQQPAPATIIVVDGSGSMHGRIGGRPKFEIARQTLAEALSRILDERELGLMAYGHRKKGDCGDIELLVPPARGSRATVKETVERMRFLGMTPLSEAVRQAASALRHTEQAATVVLITDGLETCKADPCEVAAELESSGVDFTAHVIGFGLSEAEGAKVSCLAEKTGGRFIRAGDGKALAEALAATVAEAPKPAASDRGPYHLGEEMMPDVRIFPTGGHTGGDAEAPAEVDFPRAGTAAQCAAACRADKLCAAWRYEPKGSNFVDYTRCFVFSASTEFDWERQAPDDGWASGIKAGARLLIRPYPEK